MVALVSWVDWLTMFVMIVVQLAFNELMKFGLRRRRRRQEARLPVAVAVPHAAPVENSVVTSK